MSEPTPEERGTKLWASDRAHDAERGTVEDRARQAIADGYDNYAYTRHSDHVTDGIIASLATAGLRIVDVAEDDQEQQEGEKE